MIGHKDLRMTNRYSDLEGVMDSRPLDRLAARHAGADSDDQSNARGHNGLSEAADIYTDTEPDAGLWAKKKGLGNYPKPLFFRGGAEEN